MPQVPYQGFPEPSRPEELQQIGTPSIRVSTPADAFGVGIAHAVEGLGKSAEGIGNEIFQRAHALQQLQNGNDATIAKSAAVSQMGDEHNRFTSLEGANAGPEALQQHIENLNKIRQNIRDGLPNAQVKKEFDSESMGFMARIIFNAGGHSATQMKEYSKAVIN